MKNIKPSELIRLAIHDLEVVETMPDKYVINMSTWHSGSLSQERDRCSVCLAGAVMAVSLKSVRSQSLGPKNFSLEQDQLLTSIDRFRVGRINKALCNMGIKTTRYFPDWAVDEYEDHPKEFKQQMLRMADFLEKKGL